MEEPTISIVVPVYKVPEKYLNKCIESITQQTYANIEVILVDDGSPDNCGKICEAFAVKDGRIKVVHKKNGGLSSARNTGYQQAKGKYLMFVDGDDWIEPEMCKIMVGYAEKNQVDIVMCAMIKEYEHTTERYEYNLDSERIYRNEECKWLQEQILHYNANISVAYCKLILKSVLDNNQITHDENLRQGAEGLEFNLRLFEYVKSAYFINMPFYHYVYNDNSISASHNEDNHYYVLRCFEKIKDFISHSSNKDNLEYWFYNRLLYVVVTTAISGYFSPSNKETYVQRKKKFKKFVENEILCEAFNRKCYADISFQRRVVLTLIRFRMYMIINMLGMLRRMQKGNK